MKNIVLATLLGVSAVVMTWCGNSNQPAVDQKNPSSEVVVNQKLPAGSYAIESCNKYLDFVKCVSTFAAPEADQEEIDIGIRQIEANWDALPTEELQFRCDEMWNAIVSTPDLANHSQCWISAE